MPIRYITKPAEVALVNPVTKEPLIDKDTGKQAVWTFDQIMHRLMHNPLWNETLAAMRSQQAIMDALEGAIEGVIAIAEEDWTLLKQAAETPRTQIETPQGAAVATGLGLHPTIQRQLLPLLMRIIDAPTTR